MATVYLARDLKHDRAVALKVLRPELAALLGGERFLQEIRISARLDHPHILTLIDSGESDGFVWYVMPYVRGESLRNKLTREQQLPIEETVRIATQVASALDYAHRHGVIHRDVKPENILLHEGEAVVADFGIALAVREAGGPRITESGLSLGTPQYMSPEQAAGGRELDARSDVYSLAAVVYEMLAGEPPHTGPTVQAVIARLITEEPTGLRVLRRTVTPELEAAVAKALAKAPADRFGGAAEFAMALVARAARPGTGWRRRQVRVAAGIAGVVVLAGIAALWHPWRRPAKAAAPAADVASVAVLPFDNLTGNPSDQYLSDGMTEEVIGQLAQVGGLKVISRTSTEALKGTHLTLRQIAETLAVRHILEGSVRHEGHRIRVAVDLIDATTDAHIWASSYDRDLTGVFAVQEEIARQVADSLVSTVGVRPTIGRVARTEHPGAYEAYLAGRYLMYRRTREALRGALEQFQRAIAEDSAYAPAYAGLASAYLLWVINNYRGIDLYEAYGRASALADRAIALDSYLAEAYGIRGLTMARAWASAEAISLDFKRALELQPNSPDVHRWYSTFLSRQDRYDEALAEVERATALDPLAPGVHVAFSYLALAARRYDVAVQEAARATALEPSLMRPRGFQALGALLSGNAARCATLDLGPYVGVRAMCLYSLGRVEEAAWIADSLSAAFTAGTVGDTVFSPVITARGLAEYYAWTGNAEQSLAWLDRAYSISPEGEEFYVIASGLYDKVRNDPRFKAGLQRVRNEIYDRVQRARRGADAPARLAGQCPDSSAPPCTRAAARVAPPAANSVAVLYFETPDTADAYLADGLTEDIATLLGDLSSVQVKAPGVVRRAQRATPQDLSAIARTLGVRYVVDGAVRRAGGRLRVSARLVVAGTAVSTWGEIFDRAPEQLLALPSVIAREVVTRVGGAIGAGEGAALATLRTRNPTAYDHYLRGNFYLALRSPQGTARALAEYTEAERLDSGFAAAIGRAAYTYAIARSLLFSLPGVPLEGLATRGLVVADRALRRDSTSSEAWLARAYLLAWVTPRAMGGSLDAFQRAIALDPKNAEAHHQYAAILNWLGRRDDAERQLHLALALDPGRSISYSDLVAWTPVRDTALALARADSAVALDPASTHARVWRALARLRAGDVRGAQEDAELANRLQPGDIVMENALAVILARAGDSTRARELIAHWSGRSDHWVVMAALVAVGDAAAALERLQRALPAPNLWAALHRPEFDALHGNPRYERLLAALRPAGAVEP
jgi:serine/threonine-protein kinase